MSKPGDPVIIKRPHDVDSLRAEVLTEAAKALKACVKVLERAAKALAEDKTP